MDHRWKCIDDTPDRRTYRCIVCKHGVRCFRGVLSGNMPGPPDGPCEPKVETFVDGAGI
jgi:hypothetical protein